MKKHLKRFQKTAYILEFKFFDLFISFLIFTVLVAFLFFMAFKVTEILIDTFNFNFKHMIHNVIYFIVLVKVYKLLISYLRLHHISVKYILEIAIIAPMIEVIFMVDEKPLWITSIFIIFSTISLLMYLIFYEKIKTMD